MALIDDRETLRLEAILRRTLPDLTADMTEQLAQLTRRLERLEEKQ